MGKDMGGCRVVKLNTKLRVTGGLQMVHVSQSVGEADYCSTP